MARGSERVKVLTVVGARPQFIKAAPVSRVLRRRHQEVLVHTGQHYDDLMSDVHFRQLGLPRPDENLGIGSGRHGQQTGAMLAGLERSILRETPDWVLIYGDTNSTLAGALAAAKLNVPVAHVEAGLRSYDRSMPEEINRLVADHVGDLLLAPTQTAVDNLAAEGIRDNVVLSGDVMVDVLLQRLPVARQESTILGDLGLEGDYGLATVHRAGNTDDPARLRDIFSGLAELGRPVVLPAHPRLCCALRGAGVETPANVRLIEPVGYLDMLALLDRAALVLTDSGGLQKEAYVMRVPCVTLRSETEWVETVEMGWNRLAEADPERIVAAATTALSGQPPAHPDLFGDGRASEHIVAALEAQIG
jgi:UDP-GlcNAc3NAcA epimerase